ncbi:hypothetical protein D3C72_1402880 [compost metagenome]
MHQGKAGSARGRNGAELFHRAARCTFAAELVRIVIRHLVPVARTQFIDVANHGVSIHEYMQVVVLLRNTA